VVCLEMGWGSRARVHSLARGIWVDKNATPTSIHWESLHHVSSSSVL